MSAQDGPASRLSPVSGAREQGFGSRGSSRRPDAAFACVVWHGGAGLPDPLAEALRKRPISVWQASDPYTALSLLIGHDEARGRTGPAAVLLIIEPDSLPGVDSLVAAVDRYRPTSVVWEYRRDANPPLRAYVKECVAKPDDAARDAEMEHAHHASQILGPKSPAGVSVSSQRGDEGEGSAFDPAVIHVLRGSADGSSSGPVDGERISPGRPEPTLKLAGTGRLPEPGLERSHESADGDSSGPGSPLLSDEELAMLLGDEDGEAVTRDEGPGS